ncbi:TetR/AcrR family transcriptional regulator [Marivirga sp.]|uniref:TetR/AcrR family transcriptional regulator n=1 Tax=Marivirga sp. TaxID=2018662 RepID=UPI0025DB4691|nr:TetR/AcrR family transcriptional regulator [Marivirga sp.]
MVALKTFENLSPERQEEIIYVSLEEFAFNEYKSASLSNIVAKLNLGKGSFYRYFESKKSLYYFLLNYCIDKRMKHDQELLQNPINHFFELVQCHMKAKISFDQKEPLISAFLFNILQERNSDELQDIEQYRKSSILEMTEDILKPFIANGQIRDDIEPRVLAWTIVQNQFSFQEFIEIQFKQDFQKNISNHGKLYNLSEKKLLKYGKSFIKILKGGLEKRIQHD